MTWAHVQRDRRQRRPATIHDGARKVRVMPLKYDDRNGEHVETVAKALGYFNFSDWRSGMKIKAQPPHSDGIDGRRRVPLPDFDRLDHAWRFLNYFAALHESHPAREAFWLIMGPNWRNLPCESYRLAHRVMDCALSVIVVGNERGWL